MGWFSVDHLDWLVLKVRKSKSVSLFKPCLGWWRRKGYISKGCLYERKHNRLRSNLNLDYRFSTFCTIHISNLFTVYNIKHSVTLLIYWSQSLISLSVMRYPIVMVTGGITLYQEEIMPCYQNITSVKDQAANKVFFF